MNRGYPDRSGNRRHASGRQPVPQRVHDPPAGSARIAYAALIQSPSLVVIARDLPDMTGLLLAKLIRTGLETRTLGTILALPDGAAPARSILADHGINECLSMDETPERWYEVAAGLMQVSARMASRLLVQAEVTGSVRATPILANSANISRTGLLLTTSKRLHLMDELNLAITLPGIKEKFRAIATIVRDASEVKTQWFAYGVRFTGIEPADKDRLEQFLSAEAERKTRPAES